MNWQPIETAPKDGTEVLVLFIDCGITPIVHVAFYNSKEEFYLCGGEASEFEAEKEFVGWWSYVVNGVEQEKLVDERAPTHWMPMPALPSEKGE